MATSVALARARDLDALRACSADAPQATDLDLHACSALRLVAFHATTLNVTTLQGVARVKFLLAAAAAAEARWAGLRRAALTAWCLHS